MNIWQILQTKSPSLLNVVREAPVIKDGGILQTPSPVQNKEQTPTKVHLSDIHKIIESLPHQKRPLALEFVGAILQRNHLPVKITELPGIVKAMFDSQTFSESLMKLENHLGKVEKPSSLQQQLMSMLKTLPMPFSASTTKELVAKLKASFTQLGLNFEHSIAALLAKNQALTTMKMEQLKPLLIEYLQSLKAPADKAVVSSVLSKVAGFQLLSKEDGNMGQWFIPFPIKLDEDRKDWYIHINARKRDGAIDPDYCRIVLFLDLPIFSACTLDIFVQNKSINLHIQHEYPPLSQLIDTSAGKLKESLAKQGYIVSSVKAEYQKEDSTSGLSPSLLERVLITPEKGMDIRV